MSIEFLDTNPDEVITKYDNHFSSLTGLYPEIKVNRLPHLDFKKLVPGATGLIRTGDPTAYGNVILFDRSVRKPSNEISHYPMPSPRSAAGPFVFHQPLADGSPEPSGMDTIPWSYFPGPDFITVDEVKALASEHDLGIAAVGTGAGMVSGLSLTDPEPSKRSRSRFHSNDRLRRTTGCTSHPRVDARKMGWCGIP